MSDNAGMITLNVFSNCCEVDVRRIPIKETVLGFFKTFGHTHVTKTKYFIDQSPFARSYGNLYKYIESFQKDIGDYEIYHTYGLAFGYKKSIVQAETEYVFQLEHDFSFASDLIRHSIPELLAAMKAGGMEYLRLNRAANVPAVCDIELDEVRVGDIDFCRTPCCSNAPHFAHVPSYIERRLHLVDTSRGTSKGIEENLWGMRNSYIYGPLKYPATVRHVHGRHRLHRLEKKLGKPVYRFMIRNDIMQTAYEAEYYLKRRFGRKAE
jgi:hypothetical protein